MTPNPYPLPWRYSRPGKFLRRLYRRLSADYGRLAWAWVIVLVLLGAIATGMLTSTPERPSAPLQPCGESYWEGLGRDGTPCP